MHAIARRERIVLPTGSDEKQRGAALAKVVAEAMAQVSPEAEWLLLATSADLDGMAWSGLLRVLNLKAATSLVPSWEWASRVLREGRGEAGSVEAEVLAGAGAVNEHLLLSAEAVAVQQPQVCVLLSEAATTAASKWTHARKVELEAGAARLADEEMGKSGDEPQDDAESADEAGATMEQAPRTQRRGSELGARDVRPVLRRSTHVGQHSLVIGMSACGDLVAASLANGTRLFIEAHELLSEAAALALHQAVGAGDVALRTALLDDARLSAVVLRGVPPVWAVATVRKV